MSPKFSLMLIEIIIGYGFVDEVSALYGLIWNKPKYMYTYALKALQQPTEEPLNFYMFRKVLTIKSSKILFLILGMDLRRFGGILLKRRS